MKSEKKNGQKGTVICLLVISVLVVLYVLARVFESQLESFESEAWARIQSLGLDVWLLSGIFWLVGAVAWFITYIGAPRASKKSGKTVSGIPGVALITFAIAGLLSPCKWLALLALLDYMIPLILFKWLMHRTRKN